MRFPLIGGSYVARSLIANAQRCVNYYPEMNREDSPVPITFYQRPGLVRVGGPAIAAEGRCIYQASNGTGYCVIGSGVHRIDANWELETLGDIGTSTGQCRMQDNGSQILLCDGSANGYTIDLSNSAFAKLPTNTLFQGANTLAYMDSYVLWNMPGTRLFGSTLSNEISFDPLYFASKTGYPDPLIGLIVNRHEIVLLGRLKSEIWYDAGNPLFPFAILPGAYIEHGCVSPYAIASSDIETFWLGEDLQGKGVVFALKGYDVRRISNHALELAIQSMPDISDAIAYTYQQQGHYFYVLTFPSGDQTWVYDAAFAGKPEAAWHQRAWTDSNGLLHRERLNCAAFINDSNVGLDWETGDLLKMSLSQYTDVGNPISFIKGFPHLFEVKPTGSLYGASTDNRRIRFLSFQADMDCGQAPIDASGNPAVVGLATSRDRGFSWDTTILQSAGAPGAYGTSPIWQPLGIARDMVFELRHSIAGPAALNGCWVQSELLDS